MNFVQNNQQNVIININPNIECLIESFKTVEEAYLIFDEILNRYEKHDHGYISIIQRSSNLETIEKGYGNIFSRYEFGGGFVIISSDINLDIEQKHIMNVYKQTDFNN